MRVQLWSYNYAPEPCGIAPVSEVLAQAIKANGHDVEVVAAWPHYPEPVWDHPRRPYREVIDGVPVTRLPLWAGRGSAAERIRQELSFTAAQTLAIPALRSADVVVSASPSFPALLPALINARLRNTPWVLWLHDILPDGAAATGLVDDGPVLKAARGLERLAYRRADRIVVLSQAFTKNLLAKGVPADKIDLVYDPATRSPNGSKQKRSETPRLLSMGNIGFSQGLAEVVRSFEEDAELNPDTQFVITGSGVAAPEVQAEIRSDRVSMPGLVSSERLEDELHHANLALVSQKHGGEEFNIPSKIMNFMMYGLPVVAYVDPRSEVAHIVKESGGGWVLDNAHPERFARSLHDICRSSGDVAVRSEAAREYALGNFSVAAFAEQFECTLKTVSQRGAP